MKYLTIKRHLLAALFILPLLVFVSACSKDESTPTPPAIDEAALLVAQLEGANGDYLNTACPAIVTAQEVYEDVNGAKKFYIIDIRTAADYALGHISGAVNVTMANILTHVQGLTLANYDKVIVVCYTGQSAAFATSILRMSGITKAWSMKFGMSSWHHDFDKITSKLSSDKVGVFVTTDSPVKPTAGSLPTLSTGKTTGAEILTARVADVLAAGYTPASIDAATVFTNLSQYHIINYWTTTDYTGIGHINGAYQYTPKADLKSTTFLKTLPTNKTIVVYCYTGQTSANVAAILRVMGYDAKSLSFGTQGMIAQHMKDLKKTCFDAAADCKDFPYVK